MGRIAKLIHSQQSLNVIHTSHILIVGAGGIGCQLIKILCKSQFKHLSVIDYDRVQSTNLNRQFYYRPYHINSYKVEVLKQYLTTYYPQITLHTYCSNIFNPNLPPQFWHSLTVIISALDSNEARRELSHLAMLYNKPLLDAGTMGYNGQADITIRSISACHNCSPPQYEEQYAACTVRALPTHNKHIATYVLHFYNTYFSDTEQHSLNYANAIKNIRQQCRDVYREIIRQKSQQDYMEESFTTALEKLINRKIIGTLPQIPQKDDEETIEFMANIFNLRVRMYKSTANQLKQLTKYQCKDLIFKIIPVIASANAIAAALEINNLHKVIKFMSNNILLCKKNQEQILNSFRKISFVHFSEEKLFPSQLSPPNDKCLFCSERAVYGQIYCNMKQRTFKELYLFLETQYEVQQRSMFSDSKIVLRERNSINGKHCLLHFQKIIKNNTLYVQFEPNQKINSMIRILVIHKQQIDNFQKLVTN